MFGHCFLETFKVESKYIIFAATLLIALPIGVVMAGFSTRVRESMFFLLVFFTAFDLGAVDINFISRDWYRAPTRGVEISVLDFFAWVLILGTFLSRVSGSSKQKPRGRVIGFVPFLVYAVYATFSLFWSEPLLFSLMEWTKIVRSLLIFLAALCFVQGRRELLIFAAALACGVIYEGGVCFQQRYIQGIHRLPGSLGHPNNVAYFCNIATPLLLVFGLTEAIPKRLRRLCLIATASGVLCVLMTISRTGLAVLVVVMVGTYVFSGALRLNAKSCIGAILAVLVFSGALYKASDSLLGRFNSRDAEVSERQSYYVIAHAIVSDHPFGVGLNNWSYVVSRGYCEAFYGSGCAHAFPGTNHEPHENKYIAAHTIYGLTLAELGWLGLFLLMLMWGRWLLMAAQLARWRVSQLSTRFAIGMVFAQFGNMGEASTEFVFRTQNVTFLFHVSVGTLAGMYAAARRQRAQRP